MRKGKLILSMILLFCLMPALAQEADSLSVAGPETASVAAKPQRTFWQKVGDWGIVHFFSDYDSTYFDFPAKKWSLKLTTNLAGAAISIKGKGADEGKVFRSWLSSDSKVTHTLTLGYKSYAISYTFFPYTTKSHDSRFSFTMYGNPICFDIAYNKIHSFAGYSTDSAGERFDIPYEWASMNILNINAFYVFNHKHYSFPSSVDQTYIQKKNSGSAIAGITYTRNQTDVPYLGVGDASLSVNAKLIALGGGYGYTYVPGENWQMMLMLMPKLVFYDSSSLTHGHYNISHTFTKPQFMFTGHFAVVHWFSGSFVALTASADGYRVGNISGLRLFQYQWQARLHFGVQF